MTQSRLGGRKAPSKPVNPLYIWGGVALALVLVLGGLTYWWMNRNVAHTMYQGQSIEVSKQCPDITTIIPFQLAVVDETGQALMFHPNPQSETVVETYVEGSQIYVDTPCGRYAAGVVKKVNFDPVGLGQRSNAELEMYNTLIKVPEDQRNPEQIAPR